VSEKELLAQKGRELREKRHGAPDSLEVRPRRLLIGIGIGLLALAGVFAVFMGIQQYRLRQCIPLIESTDPATKKLGVGKALALRVYFGDRPTTRAIVKALPSLSFTDREVVLTHLGYWEGSALTKEDVPIIAQSLSSPNEREVVRASRLLEKMGPDAVSALPALESALKTHSDPKTLAHGPIMQAIKAIQRKVPE
jgi:hypothetical protein